MPDTHRLKPERPIRLAEMPTKGKQFYPDREAAETEFRSLRRELAELQARLYAEGKHKLLVVLQAMDAGGKDGAIRRVFRGVNPQGVRVTSFKVPSKREMAHDFLWRIHREVPPKGMIGVFNRSHYEDVLVVRVHELVPESTWRPRFEHINQFEKLLTDTGTTLLKFYLHISPKEQKRRFQARLDDPTKHWKFSLEDLEKRKLWDTYMTAYEDVLNRCTTPWAPWYVIPADQKWYRNLAIARVIVNTIRELDPQYPEAEGDWRNLVIE
ncbi:MAG: polyphosphate kinase 2 family protein [Anaerolineae bacterium]